MNWYHIDYTVLLTHSDGHRTEERRAAAVEAVDVSEAISRLAELVPWSRDHNIDHAWTNHDAITHGCSLVIGSNFLIV